MIDVEIVRRALMMRDAGYGDPNHVWEQVATLLKEHDRLRVALAEAERERDTALTDRHDELQDYRTRAERAEADLAAAREVIERIEKETIDDVSRTDARAFLESTAYERR